MSYGYGLYMYLTTDLPETITFCRGFMVGCDLPSLKQSWK